MSTSNLKTNYEKKILNKIAILALVMKALVRHDEFYLEYPHQQMQYQKWQCSRPTTKMHFRIEWNTQITFSSRYDSQGS